VRLASWKALAARLEALHGRSCDVEDEALLGLYGGGTFDLSRVRGEAETLEREWGEVLLAMYFLRFEEADAVTLAVFSEQPEWLRELA
jgi:hypothetical protein